MQTTTLEGGHDHDIWQQEGETGYDTEQRKGAELVPQCSSASCTRRLSRRARTSTKGGKIVGNAIAGLPYIGGRTARSRRRPVSPV